MENGYYWYYGSWGGESDGWFVLQVISHSAATYAYVGEESRNIDTLPGKFIYIPYPKD